MVEYGYGCMQFYKGTLLGAASSSLGPSFLVPNAVCGRRIQCSLQKDNFKVNSRGIQISTLQFTTLTFTRPLRPETRSEPSPACERILYTTAQRPGRFFKRTSQPSRGTHTSSQTCTNSVSTCSFRISIVYSFISRMISNFTLDACHFIPGRELLSAILRQVNYKLVQHGGATCFDDSMERHR